MWKIQFEFVQTVLRTALESKAVKLEPVLKFSELFLLVRQLLPVLVFVQTDTVLSTVLESGPVRLNHFIASTNFFFFLWLSHL